MKTSTYYSEDKTYSANVVQIPGKLCLPGPFPFWPCRIYSDLTRMAILPFESHAAPRRSKLFLVIPVPCSSTAVGRRGIEGNIRHALNTKYKDSEMHTQH